MFKLHLLSQGKTISVKLAMVAAICSAVVGAMVYRAAQSSAAAEPPSRVAPLTQEPPISTQTGPRLDPPAPPSGASPAAAVTSSEDIINTHLRQMLSDESEQVRLVAVQALSTSRDRSVVTALVIALTRDVEPTIRREAALGLGKLLDERTPDDLRQLGLHALTTAAANDPDMDVCVAASSALHSLARFAHEQARPRTPAR